MRFWFCWLLYTTGLTTGAIITHYKLLWLSSLIVGMAIGMVFVFLEKWEALWVSLLFNKLKVLKGGYTVTRSSEPPNG